MVLLWRMGVCLFSIFIYGKVYFWGMRIKKIKIKNFKSLVDFELEDLKPFCAFVGPNASGKSNIFEALEFLNYLIRFSYEAPSFFGGRSVLSYNPIVFENKINDRISIDLTFKDEISINYFLEFSNDESVNKLVHLGSIRKSENPFSLEAVDTIIKSLAKRRDFVNRWKSNGGSYENDFEVFVDNFSRIFVGKTQLNRTNQAQTKLSPDASNLSQVIGKIFEDDDKRDDFIDWLRIIIPEFKDIEIKKSNIDGSFEFFLFEKSSNKPFPKYLISDGTYSILALMAAVYQTDQPQFLCIEEPENGLHPQAIQLLVDFFREKCEEYGHHIWLNTHSQTLVRCMEIDELILVNKVDGETRAKQLTKEDEVNLKTDEAWLSNALGGGILWSK